MHICEYVNTCMYPSKIKTLNTESCLELKPEQEIILKYIVYMGKPGNHDKTEIGKSESHVVMY